MAHTHEHRGTDLREPRPARSRNTRESFEAYRYGSTWVERRITQPLPQLIEAQEGQEEAPE